MIQLSPAATDEIHRLRARTSLPEARFRLSVQPGGCLDYYYHLSFDAAVSSDDVILNLNGIEAVIDQPSLALLSDLTIDYSEDLMGGSFRFYNPNAGENCGCGNSFSLPLKD